MFLLWLISIHDCTGQHTSAFCSLHSVHCFSKMTNLRLVTPLVIVDNTISVYLRLMPNLSRLLFLDILDTAGIVIFVSQIYPLFIYGFVQIWFSFLVLRSRGKFDPILRWLCKVLWWNIVMVLLMSLSMLTWRISRTLNWPVIGLTILSKFHIYWLNLLLQHRLLLYYWSKLCCMA